jgi:hypothetical protein
MVGFTTTCAISAITTKVASLKKVHGEVDSIQHYVMKFVRDLRQVNETDRHNITEILLKVMFQKFRQVCCEKTN